MRRLVIHAGWIFLGSLLIVTAGAVQYAFHNDSKDNRKIASAASCQLQNITEAGERVQLNLRCGDRSAHIKRLKEVAVVLNNPGPLTCTLFESGRAECTRAQ